MYFNIDKNEYNNYKKEFNRTNIGKYYFKRNIGLFLVTITSFIMLLYGLFSDEKGIINAYTILGVLLSNLSMIAELMNSEESRKLLKE